MSEGLADLLGYTTSDSNADSDTSQPDSPAKRPLQRPKRKLPSFEADVSSHRRSEDAPSQKKVARGEWLCHCFVEVPLDTSLSTLIQKSHEYLQGKLGTHSSLQDLRCRASTTAAPEVGQGGSGNTATTSADCLHISLTRPFTVRSYERDEYVKVASAEVKRLRTEIGSFPFSFSRFAHLANDDASRHFMVLEVGSAREKFQDLSTALSTELRRAFRAKSYYEEARFHASTAYISTSSGAHDAPLLTTRPAPALGPRFEQLIAKVEDRWGPALRKRPPVWASRIGIQVANRISYVDL